MRDCEATPARYRAASDLLPPAAWCLGTSALRAANCQLPPSGGAAVIREVGLVLIVPAAAYLWLAARGSTYPGRRLRRYPGSWNRLRQRPRGRRRERLCGHGRRHPEHGGAPPPQPAGLRAACFLVTATAILPLRGADIVEFSWRFLLALPATGAGRPATRGSARPHRPDEPAAPHGDEGATGGGRRPAEGGGRGRAHGAGRGTGCRPGQRTAASRARACQAG